MKLGIALFVVFALLAAPIACVIVVCPAVQTHDCCPKSKTFATCPFDILDSAKAALPAVAGFTLVAVPAPMWTETPIPPPALAIDGRSLHLQNRVLRI